jgi:hypothetical protein
LIRPKNIFRIQIKLYLIILITTCLACNSEKKEPINTDDFNIAFDKIKWQVKEGLDYPFRDQMLNDIVYNDSIRALDKPEIFELLGEPNRINEGHLYYMVTQKRIGLLPLTTKTMVIKLTEDNKIEWIKIHGGEKKGSMLNKLLSKLYLENFKTKQIPSKQISA